MYSYSALKGLKVWYIEEIYYADLSPVVGSEQGGYRPVVVLQNNKGNRYSTTIIVAPISSKLTKNPLPTHVMVENNCLEKECNFIGTN